MNKIAVFFSLILTEHNTPTFHERMMVNEERMSISYPTPMVIYVISSTLATIDEIFWMTFVLLSSY